MPGPDQEHPESDSSEQAYGLARLLALSDGIFAFALTLLVVQLTVPVLSRAQEGEVGAQLLAQGPSYFSYVLSFAVIASYWYQHHRIFRYVVRWDAGLVVINLSALLFIAVMPFPTAIMGRYGNQAVAVVIYAAVLGTTGLLTWLLWRYAISRRLAAPSLDRRLAGQFLRRAGVTPAVFFLSIPIALWQPFVAQATWSLIWIGLYALAPRRRTRPAKTSR